MELDSLRCPVCNALLVPGLSARRSVQRFEDCLRKCDSCRVAFSNARRNPVQIWADPEANVPEQVRGGLASVLSRSVNITNRPNKRSKFGFGTSEDAVTWTVFRYFQDHGALGRLAKAAEHAMAVAQARLVLWGVEVPPVLDGVSDIETRLEAISRQLSESPNRRTEPDAIVDFGDDGVMFIEAKLSSGNDQLKADHPNWDRYLGAGFRDCATIGTTGLYELSRNWRFAKELADGRPFTVVNLGPSSVFAEERLAIWARCLDAAAGRFTTLSWHRLLSTVPLQPWMSRFCHERGLFEQ
jgi:hypothetical protein